MFSQREVDRWCLSLNPDSGSRFHVLRRASQPHDEDGDASVHATDQRVSRKIENHAAAIALHFQHYNFARPHKSLKNPYPKTPAMAAGVDDHIWSLLEIAALLD